MLKYLIPCAVLLAVAALFIRNNMKRHEVVRYETARSEAAPAAAAPAPPASSGKAAALPRERRAEYAILPVACRTADTAGHSLLVGVKLIYEKGPLDREIRTRENNIIHLLKFVFSGRVPSQIEADPVRAEIKDRINAFLSTGQVRDVIFTTLDIIPKVTP